MSSELNASEQVMDDFVKFLDRRSAEINNEALKMRIQDFSALSPSDKVTHLPDIYLYFEKSFMAHEHDMETARSKLRKQVVNDYPPLLADKYFELIFLDASNQWGQLTLFFIETVFMRAKGIIGSSQDKMKSDFGVNIVKTFKYFSEGNLTKKESQMGARADVEKVFYILSSKLGKEKVETWFQYSYDFLLEKYKFLDEFYFLVGLLPEFLLTEQQLRLLSRSQLEDALVEKTERLEETNKLLKHEIREKEETKQALKQNSDRLNQMIANAMDAVVFTDSSGEVTLWNRQAEEIFGWKRDEILGKNLSKYIIANEETDIHEKKKDSRSSVGEESRLTKRIEEEGITKEGRKIPLELSIVAHMINDEIIFTNFIRDISERKQYERDILDAKERAEKASKAKADFLSTMSHEIRTPMNGLFGTIEYLLSEHPRQDQTDSLKLMKHSTESLLVILNDILDLSKIEEGHIEFDTRGFSLHELCNRIIATYDQKAEEKGVDLILDFGVGMPDSLLGDPVRLSQILNNLISNAIKFTYEGQVELKVSMVSDKKDATTFRFEVKDTGLGIPEKDLIRIFERFSQVEHHKEREVQTGTGLGLPIAKKLLELQGSDLFAESKLAAGSKFFFEIKLKKNAEARGPEDKKIPLLAKNLTGLKILLVEDNRINQIVVNKFLKKWNCMVDLANNGVEAMEVVKQETYDIILMDLQMPILNGYETSKKIRALGTAYFKNVPIIALTADVFPEVREKVFSAGMNDFIPKPFDPEKLYFVITSNLKVSAGKE